VITLLLWLLLLVLCWPLALVALLLWPLLWLIALPFRLAGVALEGVFELLRAIIMLPARLLSGPSSAASSPPTSSPAAPLREYTVPPRIP